MANPSVVETQIRFALSQLPVHNAHHVFEHICRRLAERFICSNLLPATGPVSAGGDQGRDFETFRTYLLEELGPHGAFLGLVSEGTIAFICTTQADNLLTKLRQDIKKVCASGHLVHEIRAFILNPVPVAARHKLETETQESCDVRLEFHDAESIANLLARPEGFWIAEQFLSIPAEIRPEVSTVSSDLSLEYVDRRRRWREKSSPNPTLGDFIDLRAGLRETIHQNEARGDFPFWIGLLRQLLAASELPAHIQQRARYELVVATFRGTHDFRTVDDVARMYLDESKNESEPALLEDAGTLLMYANTAVRAGLSSLTPAELVDWNIHLKNRIEKLITHETPHRRASLLFALGHLGLHPVLTDADVQDLSDEAQKPYYQIESGSPSTLADISMSEGQALIDVSLTLSAWTELMDGLDETPLYPIQSMGDILQLLIPLWSRLPEWRELLDRVDEAIAKRSGRHALAARARDRAVKLIRAERSLEALEEFHRTKIDWWSGETMRGSLLSMLIIAKLYLELWLPHASKSYALAVAYIAAMNRDDKLADLIPAGLLMAAYADFARGAWCGALELYEQGLAAQNELIEDGTDSEKHLEVEDALMNLAYINACAKRVDNDLASKVDTIMERLGAQEIIDGAVDELDAENGEFWESFGNIGIISRPFSDLGQVYNIRFSALGINWTLVAANDIDSARMAERFAAAAQVMLAALAQEDLCLIKTQISVHIENRAQVRIPHAERIESLPSNDGRQWVVRLAPVRNSNYESSGKGDIELLTMLTMILREASLLPDTDFSAAMNRAYERGLGHKLSPGRPYDELIAAFDTDTGQEIQRSQYVTPWNCQEGSFKTHNELRWQDGPGPTFSQDIAQGLLQTRYGNLAKSLRITITMLASSEEFRPVVETLRAEGWLDWHILTAILNIVMNYRFPTDPFNPPSEENQREMMQAAYGAESATAKPVPIGFFSSDQMDKNRMLAIFALLNHWELECHQKTPDIPAIERLLAERYGYWTDDVPHYDPFPETGQSGIDGGIIVIKDTPTH